MMIRARREHGFTLVELMVVIAIVGVLSAVLFGVGSNRQGGRNAQTIAEQTVSALNMARTRAVATRRIHRVEIMANDVRIWASSVTGFATPTAWTFVQRYSIPNNVQIWGAESTIRTTTGNTITNGAGLTYNMDYKPDGSATGGTLYIRENSTSAKHQYRVLVYRATGSAYARSTW